ncbi:MAG: DUF1598 domain-containing protein [Pirellulales bacterium]|nr:DUF1598 domain-containing protein [Pirellulales bacterium]
MPLVAVACLAWCNLASAQTTGNSSVAGVSIDADGVLRKQLYTDPSGMLTRERVAAAKTRLDSSVLATSKLRKISLNRLEKALAERIAINRAPTEEMLYLAGITRLKHVFFYPETGDIVVAGPAEGWMTDLSGRAVGLSQGRPVLELQDLVVALRAFPPGDVSKNKEIGCSIDPTPEGLARMQEFLQAVGPTATPDDTQSIVDGLRSSLGMQNVTIRGVSPKTHFAQVLVEADYRMKLIGIGLEQPPIKLASYVDKASAAQVSRNAMQRWYFMPDYKCVRTSEDGLAMELIGDGVQLVGADEVVVAGGQRRQAATGDRASQAFVRAFTQKYPQLAERSPVYAQLRNLIDMAVAAAYVQQEDFYGQASWTPTTFADESAFPVETSPEPRNVETAVTSIWKGNRLMTPVGGGVSMHASEALIPDNMLEDEGGELAKKREAIELNLAEGQWWWD